MHKIHTSLPGVINAVQAAQSGSFSAAAKVLGVTPAAVSKNVAALEVSLGIRLFNRTTRKLALTEEGKIFVAQARSALHLLDDAADTATHKQAPHGTVRVNCSVGFGRQYVLPSLPGFFAAHPKVQIDLALDDHAVDLVGEGFDIGIRGGSQPPEGMVSRKICTVGSVLVATPRYLKQRGTPLIPTDLVNHSLLRIKFLSGRVYPWLFKGKAQGQADSLQLDSQVKLLISDPQMILDAALLHMGIARLGRHHAHAALQSGALVELLADHQLPSEATMSLFYPHRAGLAPRVKVFVSYLMDWFEREESLNVHSKGRKR
jgi:DNA-binding transcriptional LysR family regulator